MSISTFISGYVNVKDNKVLKDGELFFSADATISFDEFIRSLFNSLNLSYSPFYKMDDLSKLGFSAAEILLQKEKRNWEYKEEEIGVVFSNKSSSLDTDLNYYDTIKDRGDYFPSPAVFVYTLPNIVVGEICIRNNIKGENSFFVFPEFNSEFTTKYVNSLFETGKVKGCLVGWVELFQGNYEAFMYFVRNSKMGVGISHTSENINNLYNN